ncbi:MAG: hypothetical protein Q8S84_04605 [bacterium]|nr:hypothetical protein [bacterium]
MLLVIDFTIDFIASSCHIISFVIDFGRFFILSTSSLLIFETGIHVDILSIL